MKTLNMTRNLLAALLLTCAAALNALGQKPLPGHEGVYTYGDPSNIMEFIDTCEFVFEGQVLDGFEYDVRECTFVAYNVKVTRVFRGDLDTGNVQIIRLVRRVGAAGFSPKQLSDGVFFGTRKDLEFMKQPDSVWTNKPVQRVFESWVVARYVFGKHKQTEGMSLDFGQMGGMDFSNPDSFMNYFEKRGTIERSNTKYWTPLVRQDLWKLKKNPPKKEEPFVPYDNTTRVPGKTPVRVIQPVEKDSFLQEVEKSKKRMAKPQGNANKTATSVDAQLFITNFRMVDKELVCSLSVRVDSSVYLHSLIWYMQYETIAKCRWFRNLRDAKDPNLRLCRRRNSVPH